MEASRPPPQAPVRPAPVVTTPPETYAAALAAPPPPPKVYTIDPNPDRPKRTHLGRPAVFFSKKELAALAKPLQHALIGKNFGVRPTMEKMRTDFETAKFKGAANIGLIDDRQVLIRFDMEEDYCRCWLHEVWNFGPYSLRIVKWTPDFNPSIDSPIVPVWISLHGLPFQMFDESAVLRIGNHVGQALKTDLATVNLSRPHVARVCVEIDVRNPLEEKLWIGEEEDDDGYWQYLEYEYIPPYCFDCCRVGHDKATCPPPEAPKLGGRKYGGERKGVLSRLGPQNGDRRPNRSWKQKPLGSEPSQGMEVLKPTPAVQNSVPNVQTSGLRLLEKAAGKRPMMDLETSVIADPSASIVPEFTPQVFPPLEAVKRVGIATEQQVISEEGQVDEEIEIVDVGSLEDNSPRTHKPTEEELIAALENTRRQLEAIIAASATQPHKPAGVLRATASDDELERPESTEKLAPEEFRNFSKSLRIPVAGSGSDLELLNRLVPPENSNEQWEQPKRRNRNKYANQSRSHIMNTRRRGRSTSSSN